MKKITPFPFEPIPTTPNKINTFKTKKKNKVNNSKDFDQTDLEIQQKKESNLFFDENSFENFSKYLEKNFFEERARILFNEDENISSISFNPIKNEIAISFTLKKEETSNIKIYKYNEEKKEYQIDENQKIMCDINKIKSLKWGENNKLLIAGNSTELLIIDLNLNENNVTALTNGHKGNINCAIWSPEEKKILSVGQEAEVLIWNSPKFENIKLHEDENIVGPIFSACWSPNGERIAFGGQNKMINIYDSLTYNKIFILNTINEIKNIEWQKNDFLITYDSEKKITFWNVFNGKEKREIQCDFKIRSLKIDYFNDEILIGSDFCKMCILDNKTGIILKKIQIAETQNMNSTKNKDYIDKSKYEIKHLDLFRRKDEESNIIVVGDSNLLTFYERSKIFKNFGFNKIKGHPFPVNCLAWSPKGEFLASGSISMVRIWNINKDNQNEVNHNSKEEKEKVLKEVTIFRFNHKEDITSLAWSKDERKLYIGNGEGKIYVIDVSNIREKKEKKKIIAVHEILNSENQDKMIIIMNSENNDIKETIISHDDNITKEITMIKSGFQKIITLSADNSLKVWNSSDYSSEILQKEHSSRILCFDLDDLEIRIISGSRDKSFIMWHFQNGKWEKKFKKLIFSQVFQVLFSREEGNYNSLVGTKNGIIIVIDNETFKEIYKISCHKFSIDHLSWDHTFNFFFTGCQDENCFKIWDYNTFLNLKTISVEEEKFEYSIIESNNNKILSFSGGKNIYIYEGYKDIWRDYEDYKIYCFISEILTETLSLKYENKDFINDLINYPFVNYESIFHIMLKKKLVQLKILIEFCEKTKIYPKKFIDRTGDNSLIKLMLTSEMSMDIIKLLINYISNSNVPLGCNVYLNEKDLKEIILKFGGEICLKFINTRFKISTKIIDGAIWLDPYYDRSQCLLKTLDKFNVQDLKFRKVILKLETNSKTLIPYIYLTDIPYEAFNHEFFYEIFKSEIFDNFCKSPLILSILNFKWEEYGKKKFIRQSYRYFICLLLLLIISLFIFPKCDHTIYDIYNISFIILNFVLIIVLFFIIKQEIYEYKQDKKISVSYYTFWNNVDIIYIILNSIFIMINLFFAFEIILNYSYIRILHSFCIFISFFRMFSFFRIEKEAAFFIEIVQQVVKDMKWFFILMLLLILNFSFSGYI